MDDIFIMQIKLFKNGDGSTNTEFSFRSNQKFDNMLKQISEKLKFTGYKKLRFFTVTGVEIFLDDFVYIKNGDILYVSQGN